MKRITLFIVLGFSISFCGSFAQSKPIHGVIKTFHIVSPGGWDYIKVNNGKIYVSHSSQVNILDETTGDSVGVITGTMGVHGIAFDNSLGKGFTSNGRSNTVTEFDLKTNNILAQIGTGKGPDAIMFEPFNKTIITCNGGGNELSVIDPKQDKVVVTIPLPGRPEEAVSDGKGMLYVNLEDKGEIAVIDLKLNKVIKTYTLAKEAGPSGLAIDTKTNRLFSACSDTKQLMVLDAKTGKIVASLPMGDGCDGDLFDNGTKMIYTSNGEGTITAIKEISADKYEVVETIKTKPGARTSAIDEKNHLIFLPTADFEPRDPKATQRERRKMIPGTFQVLVVQ